MELKPGFKQTEVGVIPEDWRLRPLLSAVRIASGQVDPKIEPFRSMILVAPDHIEIGTGRLLQKETAAEQHAISGKYLFESGDIVYSKIRPYLKKAILADFGGLCSADMYPLKPVADVSSGFMFAALLGYRFSKYAESVSVRSGMPKINRSELAEYTIALPPTKAEQEAIAEALSDADALIECLEQLVAKKRAVKQGAMQELLTGKRRLSGFHGKLKRVSLGGLGTWVGGGTPSMTEERYWNNGTIPWITSADVRLGTIANDLRMISSSAISETSTRLVPKGAVVVVTRSGILRRFLPFCSLRNEVAINQDIKALIPNGLSTGAFIAQSLECYNKEILASCMKTGTTVESIEMAWLNRFEIVLPTTLAEQTAIATILSDMDAEIAALEAKLAKARQIKQGMMQELLTGRIRLI